ncbi:helix-turn-helix domain-containing protein [Sabulicella rubraurantiaca]|uniref:helix-turn-helix domain-containing protein n=1 Tax=Sabulicella rubraurantiaca TaxID=2811429 RepID=UPI001A956DCD|nr:helix-turn-helix domain-containing protein [Sabulicella rubraurantiaca]
MFDNVKRFSRTQETLAVDAARLGDELREAREAMGTTLEDMARHLRIRRVYLTALEEGRLKDLPPPAYTLGFVRNYAAALGLDAAEMVRRFRDVATGATSPKTALVFPEPVPERGFPAGVTILAGAALLIGSYVAWYSWSGTGERSVDTVLPVPARLESASRDGEALRPPQAPAAVPPAQPPSQATPSLPPLPVPVQVPVQVPASQPPASSAASAALPADGSRIVLRFKGEAWTQIRDSRNGQLLLNQVMRAGESFSVPNREGLTLTTGSAQNMEIVVDGQVSPALSSATGVRRNIALVPDQLRNPPAQAPRPQPASPRQ